jgi:mono/diheme cytochrome c family protein
MFRLRLCAGLVALTLVLAACGGSSNSSSSSSSASSAPSSSSSSSTSTGGAQNASAEGKQVFTQNCKGCHTLKDAGATGTVGPNLDDLKPPKATLVRQVNNGGGPMPAFKGMLTPAQINAVATYVSTVAGQS